MEFHLLRTFDVVASLLNFNRAASTLHCTQSTVSAQIRALEEDLNTRLFERLGRKIALTAAGKELQRHTRRLLHYEYEVRTAVRKHGESLGILNLRVPQSVAELHLPAILKRFNAMHPHVGFNISNCGYFPLPDDLRSGTIDAGFLLTLCVQSVDLHTSLVLTEPMVFVTHPSSNLARRPRLSLKDLSGQTLLMPKHDCAYRMDLEHNLRKNKVEMAAVIEINSLTAIIRLLQEGLGVSFLPRGIVAREIEAGHVAELDWKEPLTADLYLMRHRDKPLTGIHGAFIKTAEAYFAERRGHHKLPAPQKHKRCSTGAH